MPELYTTKGLLLVNYAMKSFATTILIQAPAERITVHAKIAPGRAFPVVVSELTAPQKMVWTGAMPLGLFTGPLAPLFTRSIPDLQPAFEAFAAGLKQHAEKHSQAEQSIAE